MHHPHGLPAHISEINQKIMSSDSIANKIAKENGFDKAKFLGKHGDDKIYMGYMDDTERLTGLPLFIIVHPDGATYYEFGFEYMDKVKEEVLYGKKIFNMG